MTFDREVLGTCPESTGLKIDDVQAGAELLVLLLEQALEKPSKQQLHTIKVYLISFALTPAGMSCDTTALEWVDGPCPNLSKVT